MLRVAFAARSAVAGGDQRVLVSLTPTTCRMAEGFSVPDRRRFQVTVVARILLVAAEALLSIEVGRGAMSSLDEFGRMRSGCGILVTDCAVVALTAWGPADRGVGPIEGERSRNAQNRYRCQTSHGVVTPRRLAPRSIQRMNVCNSSFESGVSAG